MTRILVFGTFDGIHEGHRRMLREAKALGDYLIVAVAPDAIVEKLKGTMPWHSMQTRIAILKKEHIADDVVLADDRLHSWKIIKKYKPQVIALGYDQHELKAALKEYLDMAYPDIETEAGWQSNPKKPRIVILSAYQPEKYKSSLLR